MSRTILAEVDGFTPLMDIIVKEYGIVIAAVFGRVWRYCQYEQGVCNASLDTIANELMIDYRTVLRHIKTLTNEGYLFDMTPNLRNRPHTYADTGKVTITARLAAGMTLSQGAMTLSQSHPDLKSHEETIKKQIKKEDHAPNGAQNLTVGQSKFLQMFGSKRFANKVQLQAVHALETAYGTDKLLEGATWAATTGMSLGRAVQALQKALPSWGEPKKSAPEPTKHYAEVYE